MSVVTTTDMRVSKLSKKDAKLFNAGFIDEFGQLTSTGKEAIWQVMRDSSTDALIELIKTIDLSKAA